METDKAKNEETYLEKISKVFDCISSSNIPFFDDLKIKLDNLDAKSYKMQSAEIILDMQNIPKWWRAILNWGVDIYFCLEWASCWMKLLDEKRLEFKMKTDKSEFIAFAKSEFFDPIAWTNTKYHLDNAIIRLYSFREKLAWLLNSHHKLCLDSFLKKNQYFSFLFYNAFAKNLPKEFQKIDKILNNYFISGEVKKIAKLYRNNFIHNETPSVDWPKEPQAKITSRIDKDGNEYKTIPFFGLQTPDFALEDLMTDTLLIWSRFVEGTMSLFELIEELYYSNMSSN